VDRLTDATEPLRVPIANERADRLAFLIERAKGILMERHSIDEESAFEMLRARSRSDNRKLIELAAAVADGHRLLPAAPERF
jgi:AmiR/NasT family two-component response regulator